ncbi:MAG TPA: roadblock/LC7 domain-containing protein [Methanolinea sp.]|nr:roadblock/LC7 domain-containing protein [Methanolinea sp.]HQK55592.1 roadblock/LC7 domain-containing protein [Methanolinea sp.]
MSLPEGTYAGVSADPLREDHPDGARPFTGKVEVLTDEGKGLLVVVKGQVTAACYQDREGVHRGRAAVTYLLNRSREIDLPVRYAQYHYSYDELQEANEICREEGLFLKGEDRRIVEPVVSGPDDTLLKRLSGQPGVRAVSIFFEGFPVQSAGDGDFEQVAAMAEDFLRAGRKVAENLRMGVPDQIILESDQKKCIIAPYGDLSICLLTDADANLGLIRLAMRSIQREMKERG